MRSPRLTDAPLWRDGRLCHRYRLACGEVLVRDSCRNFLLVREMLADPLLSPDEKAGTLWRMVIAEPSSVPAGSEDAALAGALWEAFGIDTAGEHAAETGGRRSFDWDVDAARIRASLLMAYGLDWDDASRRLSYAEVCDLLAMLCETEDETPFSRAVRYRVSDPPQRTRWNGDYVDAWMRERRRYALDGGPAQTAAQRAASDRALNVVLGGL